MDAEVIDFFKHHKKVVTEELAKYEQSPHKTNESYAAALHELGEAIEELNKIILEWEKE